MDRSLRFSQQAPPGTATPRNRQDLVEVGRDDVDVRNGDTGPRDVRGNDYAVFDEATN